LVALPNWVPRGHLRRQPRPAVPAAPQRQDPRPVASDLRPRHRDQDLDQLARQDLHRRHRPTPDLSRPRSRASPSSRSCRTRRCTVRL